MKSQHTRLWATIAAGVLLAGNLAMAAPAMADPVSTSQEPTSTQTTTAPAQNTSNDSLASNGNTGATAASGQAHGADNTATSVANAPDYSALAQQVAGQSATQIADQIKAGKINDQDLINYTYQQIDQKNGKLNNVIYEGKADAQQQLKDLQKSGSSNKPFYGVPILIKGLGQAYKGYPNTNGLPFEKGMTYHYTKNFVQRLKDLGFIILGETNFPELGLTNVTMSNLNGVAHNPWNLDHNTGGSSGGATASVAAGIVPIATGNDAGGSLRIPASWSGVIGLKPTQGLILGDSTTPSVVNFAETRDINDTVTLLKGLMNPAHASLLKSVPTNLKSVKIAYSLTSPVGTPVSQDAKNAVLKAVDFLRSQGFTVVEQSSPVDGVKLMQNYYLGALSDGSVANYLFSIKYHRNLTSQDVDQGLVSPMTYALYEASKKAPSSIRQQYQSELTLINQQMTAFHNEYPVYLTPTTATTAPLNSDPAYLPEYVAKLKNIKNLSFSDQMQLIYDAWLHGLSKTPFTQLANLSGDPALSLPTYVSASGLPLGIQLEGGKGSDLLLLALGKLFEDNHQFEFLSDYLAQQSSQQPRQPANGNTADSSTTHGQSGKAAGNRTVAQPVGSTTNKRATNTVNGSQGAARPVTITSDQIDPSSETGSVLPQTGDHQATIVVSLGFAGMLVSLTVAGAELGKQRQN